MNRTLQPEIQELVQFNILTSGAYCHAEWSAVDNYQRR